MNCERCGRPLLKTFDVRYQGNLCWDCVAAIDKEADRLLTQVHQRRIEPGEGREPGDED